MVHPIKTSLTSVLNSSIYRHPPLCIFAWACIKPIRKKNDENINLTDAAVKLSMDYSQKSNFIRQLP